MSRHRYARRELNGDLLRAGAGIALCAVPLAFADVGTTGLYVLAAPAALFAVFGARTLRNRRVVIEVDENGIGNGRRPGGRIAWSELDTIKLSYFSTRRDRENGWMQLKLSGGGERLAITSALDGFETVCRAAWRAARAGEIEISDATARNFAALGLGGATTPREATPAALSGWGDPAEWRR